MIRLATIPDGIAEIRRYYGNPEAENFTEKSLVRKRAPFPLRLDYARDMVARNLYAHTLVIDAIIDALQEIMDYQGHAWLRQNDLDLFGGIWSTSRKMRAYDALSAHCWGIAIDYCPHIGRLGNHEDVKEYPRFIVNAFERRGFDWGGSWPEKYLPDAMHFQACTGY